MDLDKAKKINGLMMSLNDCENYIRKIKSDKKNSWELKNQYGSIPLNLLQVDAILQIFENNAKVLREEIEKA